MPCCPVQIIIGKFASQNMEQNIKVAMKSILNDDKKGDSFFQHNLFCL